MKIALIGPTYPYAGGISHFNTLLAKELQKKNEVKVFSYYRRYPSFLYPGKEQEDKKSEIRIEVEAERTLSMINPFSWIKTALKIRKFNPEKIVFHFVTPFTSIMFSLISFISKFKRKTKTVLICHNLKPHETNLLDKILGNLIFWNADKFITHSKDDFKILNKRFKKRKVIKAFHPIYDFFNFNIIKKEEAKK
ncbi:glycosyl transferase family 1, partial [Candidatus Micrarchaeota archaeon]|nr:glycosyl transferase family 1 [Candidatus Micrarchaeota archaeon]